MIATLAGASAWAQVKSFSCQPPHQSQPCSSTTERNGRPSSENSPRLEKIGTHCAITGISVVAKTR